jgi:hypothetical protein
MAVEIIVEDGSGVANANAYITVAEARLYATQRGITLPTEDDEVAAMIIQATDFLESKSCEYAGRKTSPVQSLEWPRIDAYLDGDDYPMFPSNSIPKSLKQAQMALVVAVSQGIVLLPNIGPQDYVIEETVGPITTKYANPIAAGIETTFTGVDFLLAPLFGKCGQCGGFSLRTVRV